MRLSLITISWGFFFKIVRRYLAVNEFDFFDELIFLVRER